MFNFIRVGRGRVSWSRVNVKPVVLEWSLAKSSGRHRVPGGYGIRSVSVDPDERFIAVSLMNVSRFHSDDRVYVLRAKDGSKVFQSKLPYATRTPIAFIGQGYFAFSSGGVVHVHAVPD